jgi:hypothetical protein
LEEYSKCGIGTELVPYDLERSGSLEAKRVKGPSYKKFTAHVEGAKAAKHIISGFSGMTD